jgi:hypothetical protein
MDNEPDNTEPARTCQACGGPNEFHFGALCATCRVLVWIWRDLDGEEARHILDGEED